MNQKLFNNACSRGHFETAKMLEQMADIKPGYNNLFISCKKGHFEIVKWLHSLGLDEKNDHIFGTACREGHFEIAKWLHSLGCNINSHSNYAFSMACKNGHFEIAKWLHSIGSNIDGKNDYAIRRACQIDHIEIVKWLHGMKPDVPDESLFCIMCKSGNLEMAKWFHDISEIDLTKRPYLKVACLKGRLEMAKWLLESYRPEGECIDRIFFHTCAKGHLETAKWLHSQGANIHTNRDCVLYLVLTNGHLHIIEWLKEVNEWYYVNKLNSALLNACVHNKKTEANNCIISGADVNYRNGFILQNVCREELIEMAEWLYSVGANIGTDEVFYEACAKGHLDMAKWIYSKFTILDIDNPFIDICGRGYLEIAKWLHDDLGADMDTIIPITFELCCKKKYSDMVNWMITSSQSCKEYFADIFFKIELDFIEMLDFSEATINMLKSVHRGILPDTDDEIDFIVVEIMCKHNKLDMLEHMKIPFLSYDVKDGKICSYVMKRLRSKNARNS